jgi:hypothetical protein
MDFLPSFQNIVQSMHMHRVFKNQKLLRPLICLLRLKSRKQCSAVPEVLTGVCVCVCVCVTQDHL